MVRPRPVPTPGGLVVKNGSKMRSLMAGSTPEPELKRARNVILRLLGQETKHVRQILAEESWQFWAAQVLYAHSMVRAWGYSV